MAALMAAVPPGITRFSDGLELAEPGIVQPQLWRPAGPVSLANVTAWCGVARKA